METPNDFISVNESTKMSPKIDLLAQALSKAQGVMKPAEKNSVNPHFKSRYADLAAIVEVSKQPLSQNDLSIAQSAAGHPPLIKVTTILMHKSGQWISGDLTLKSKDDSPQAMGSALTYARRYALASILNVAADDDDDGNAANTAPRIVAPQYSAPSQPAAGNPGDFLVPFGPAKGKRISDIGVKDAQGSITYWTERAKKDGKPLDGTPLAYVNACIAYVASQNSAKAFDPDSMPDASPFEDVPF